MIDIKEAKRKVEMAYPDRNVREDPIIHNNYYIFLTFIKSKTGMDDINGVGRWVNMTTGEISEKSLHEELANDKAFADKFAKAIK